MVERGLLGITRHTLLFLSLRQSQGFRSSVPELEEKTKCIFIMNHNIIGGSICIGNVRGPPGKKRLLFLLLHIQN